MNARRIVGIGTTAAAIMLSIGVATGLAHGGLGGGGFGPRMQSDQLTSAAKELGVDVDKLKAAILKDAGARIDKAVKDGKLDEDQAADLKDNLAANAQHAMRLTTATGVARELGVTKAKLDDGFRAARKAELTARIDQAVKDGMLTDAQGKELKTNLTTAPFPGYGAAGFGFGHRGGFGGRHGGGMFPGFGGGLPGLGAGPAAKPL